MYNVDYEILVKILLPWLVRKPRFVALLSVLFSPFSGMWLQFIQFKDFVQLQLNCTGQVIYLERLLNLMFNNGEAGIEIRDGEHTDKLYLSNKNEGYEAVYLHNKAESYDAFYLQNSNEFTSDCDFYVCVPGSIYDTINIERLRAVVNKYKIADKTFNIISI